MSNYTPFETATINLVTAFIMLLLSSLLLMLAWDYVLVPKFGMETITYLHSLLLTFAIKMVFPSSKTKGGS